MIPNQAPNNYTSSRQLVSGADMNNIINQLNSVQNGVIAQADGTKANATQLNAAVVQVSTVAGAADSVKLPKGFAGLEVFVVNQGAQAMQVFGFGTDDINGAGTAVGVSQTADTKVIYRCIVGPTMSAPVAQWVTFTSA